MTLQSKFDEIIECIEYLVKNGEEDIPQALAKETGFNLRVLGDAFQFITDITLVKYIRQRRLVHALTNKLQKNLSVEDVAAEIRFCDAAAFTKACKSEFNLTPSQITEEVLDKYPPLNFARVTSDGNAAQTENYTLTNKNNNTDKSVSDEQFAEIKRALEISAIYGFDDDEAKFVYRFANEWGITVDEAAEICEEMRIEEKYDLYPSEMQQALSEIRGNGYSNLHMLPDNFWDVYLSEVNSRHGWDIPYVYEIAEALNSNGMCAMDLDQIAMHADTYDVDILEAIENFEEYEKEWDDMICDAMANGIPEDDAGGFGYRSIWEFDEDDPDQYKNDVFMEDD